MPTTPGTPGETLDPKAAQAKFLGLITETGDELPDEPAPAVPADTPPAVEPVPPETPRPPEPSDSGEPAPEDDVLHTVVVDGEAQEVSLRQLKDDYSYKARNTLKAQELAAREQALEPELRQRIESEVMQERQEYQQALAKFNAALERLEGEPDWSKRRAEVSDAEFLKEKADWEAGKWQRDQLRREEERVAEMNRQASDKQYANYLRAEEDKLRAAIPEWSDQAKAKAELANLATFVRQTYQIPDAQVANAFTSASAILLARDAKRFRDLRREPNAQVKAKVSPIKPARPGTPDRPRPNAKQEQLIEATKSGRQRDAMSAILGMLPDD